MHNKNRIPSIILISLLIIWGTFALTPILAPSVPIANKSSDLSKENIAESPEISDVSGSYDLGDGNTMDIDAIDNTTYTTMYNDLDEEYFTIESEKNDTSTSTILNDNLTMTTDGDTPIQLNSPELDLAMPDKNQLDLYTSDSELHINATRNDAECDLDSFYIQGRDMSSTGFFNLSYIKDDIDGYDLTVLGGFPTGYYNASLNYYKSSNHFKWRDDTFSPYITPEYTIKESGVWQDDSQVIDWTNNDLEHYSYHYENAVPYSPGWDWIYEINITKEHNITTIHYYAHYADINRDFYELVFIKSSSGAIVMDFVAKGVDILFHWMEHLITLYYPLDTKDYLVVTIYLWDMHELIYIVLMEKGYFDYLEVRVFRKWIQIMLQSIIVEIIYYVTDVIIYNLKYRWYLVTIESTFIFYHPLNIFLSYMIEIQIYFWIYIYYVPTLILPNFITITILESVYTNDWFYITIRVTDFMGYAVNGAMITGKWNGIDLVVPDNITDNGDGTFDLAVTPIYVPEFDTPIWLNLTATKTGYIDGELNTEIAVEPFYTDPPPQLIINIINSIYTSEWFNLTVAVTNCSGDLETGTILTGYWNGTAIQAGNIKDNGDGTFNITLEAILVSPGDPGIDLSLTATKTGYAEGTLDTELSVDPEAVSKIPLPPSEGGGGGGGGGGGDESAIPGYDLIYIISLVLGISVIVAIFKFKKRKQVN